jgi:hypothetical protein
MTLRAWYLRAAIIAAVVTVLGLFFVWVTGSGAMTGGGDVPADSQAIASKPMSASVKTRETVPPALPDESRFVPIAEDGNLALYADPITGHFYVTSLSSGQRWLSEPRALGEGDDHGDVAQ